MLRSFLALGAIAAIGAPAAAATYSATLSAPTTGRVIAHDISWNCGGSSCQGVTENSRPAVLCQSLAKRAGRVESFLVDGRPIPAPELDRCNASAKPAVAAVADR